ncbi:flagella synthesis protein FlgN [Frateuria sp. STR12]|uniref:flagella synthesis protein FlgN n=1 Tax=Frateuria hangzhouensis TaxID=2995589 RepID=UPI0022608338|nr:flagellar protein FlgN [Frateuria sp. STR12]MCX7513117.1 flagellar protein FlgN [Frateuria sp. STR12]
MSKLLHHELETALAAVVEDLHRSVTELAATLAAEREALVGADAVALDREGARKQALMQQMEQLDAERVQMLKLEPAAAAQVEPRWREVLELLRGCHEMNQRNGHLVGQRLTQVREALAVLTGQGGDARGVYGPGGEVRTALRSHHLASA